MRKHQNNKNLQQSYEFNQLNKNTKLSDNLKQSILEAQKINGMSHVNISLNNINIAMAIKNVNLNNIAKQKLQKIKNKSIYERTLSPWTRRRGQSISHQKGTTNVHIINNNAINMQESNLISSTGFKQSVQNSSQGNHIQNKSGTNLMNNTLTQTNKLNEFLRKIQFSKKRRASDVQGLNSRLKTQNDYEHSMIDQKNKNYISNNLKRTIINTKDKEYVQELIFYPPSKVINNQSDKLNRKYSTQRYMRLTHNKQKTSRTLGLSTQYFSGQQFSIKKSASKNRYQNHTNRTSIMPIHVNIQDKTIIQSQQSNRKQSFQINKNQVSLQRKSQEKLVRKTFMCQNQNKLFKRTQQDVNNNNANIQKYDEKYVSIYKQKQYMSNQPTYASPSKIVYNNSAVKHIKQKHKKSYRMKTQHIQFQSDISLNPEGKYLPSSYRQMQKNQNQKYSFSFSNYKKHSKNANKVNQFDEDFLYKTFSEYKRSGLNNNNLRSMLQLKFFNNKTFKENINNIINQGKSQNKKMTK